MKKAKVEGVADVVKECGYCYKAPCVLGFVYDEMASLAEGMPEYEVENNDMQFAMYHLLLRSYLVDSASAIVR